VVHQELRVQLVLQEQVELLAPQVHLEQVELRVQAELQELLEQQARVEVLEKLDLQETQVFGD
jgi:hypothetical protein